jgi:hypothetical protein
MPLVTSHNREEFIKKELQKRGLLKEEKPKVYYRGTTGSDEKIKNGIGEGHLWITPHHDVARSYAGTDGNIEKIGLHPDAKILIEGTKEFSDLTKRKRGKLINTMRKGENIKTAADDALNKAREAGYHGIEFNSMKDLGTAIFDTDKVIRNYEEK